ncbi:MAG: glycine zipper 2TM domain-containing protein [Caulobacter sp.]|nr:glycine zipper 2TM domain-containing protein [Caulobacter sp.]
MKTKTLAFALASVVALSAGAAAAQSRVPSWQEYQAQQRDYQRQQGAYEDSRASYDDQRATYEARREQYLRDRAAYDRRYGQGAYERRYGAWVYQSTPRDAGYYGRDASATGYADRYRDSPCEQRRGNRTAAGLIIGALAGAAIGSNLAESDVQTEGAVLGAVIGGGLGAGIGRDSARCDTRGYYYSRAQTIPYRESGYYRDRRERSGRYDYSYYQRRGCRLAVAPAEYRGDVQYRYVRVCPDRQGRYRITG